MFARLPVELLDNAVSGINTSLPVALGDYGFQPYGVPVNMFRHFLEIPFPVFADFGVLGDARIPEMKKSRVCTQETGGGDSSPNRAVRTGKIPRKMRVSLRCPYGRMTYTGSNGRQNALSAVQPSPTAPIADDTIVLPIIPIPVKFVNIFLLFSP